MSTNTTEHKNDHYTVQVERAPGCQVTFTITVSPDVVKKQHANALKAINKQVSLPGFRKGRAPAQLVTKHYGSHVEKEWKENLLQNAFHEAVKLVELAPFTRESVSKADIKTCTLDDGAVVVVNFESMPDVPHIDVAELTIEKVDVEPVTDKKIEQIIEDIRYQFAEWENVEGRPVEEGDFVDVDIANLDNEGSFICQDTRLEVAEGKMGSWLRDLLIGMNVGDSEEAQSALDEGQNIENFKPTNCKVTVKSIAKSVLPEVNDALAEKAGVKDADELRSKVVADLESLHKRQAEDKMREQLRKAVVEKYYFDVPASLIEEEVQNLVVQRMTEEQGALTSDEILSGEKIEEIQNSSRKQVQEMYCWHFIANQIAREEKIEVDNNELTGEMMRRIYAMLESGEQMDPNEEPQEVMQRMYTNLLSRNVADFILAKVS